MSVFCKKRGRVFTFSLRCDIIFTKTYGVAVMEGYFRVSRIEGEYAYLAPESGGEELFVAMALLPIGVDIDTRLFLCDMEFKIV